MNGFTIIISAKDESLSIGTVIDACSKYTPDLLVIVPDDDTKTIEVARAHNAKIYFDKGEGKGYAIRLGLKHAKYEAVLFIDADLSHDPAEIPKLVEAFQKNSADIVIASRVLGGSEEFGINFEAYLREWGSNIINWAIGKRFKLKITDAQNGFRVIRKSWGLNLDLREKGTTIEQEMVIKTLHKGGKIIEIPSYENRRKFGRSKINLWKDSFRYGLSALYYLYLYR
jgi:glycosyltransferase involved in cell wall biosynthesis